MADQELVEIKLPIIVGRDPVYATRFRIGEASAAIGYLAALGTFVAVARDRIMWVATIMGDGI